MTIIPAMTKVYQHLNEMKNYFEKDIEQIHVLSKTAEAEEIAKAMVGTTTMSDGSSDNSYRNRIPWPPLARCTIPQSMTLFSVVDFIGYLIDGVEPDPLRTENHFKLFFKWAKINNITTEIPISQIELLNRCARQGMIHNYFAKQNMEIGYHSSNPANKLFFINPVTGGIVLNVNELKRIVLSVYEKLIISGDSILYATMENNYEKLIDSYAKQTDALIQEVKDSL